MAITPPTVCKIRITATGQRRAARTHRAQRSSRRDRFYGGRPARRQDLHLKQRLYKDLLPSSAEKWHPNQQGFLVGWRSISICKKKPAPMQTKRLWNAPDFQSLYLKETSFWPLTRAAHRSAAPLFANLRRTTPEPKLFVPISFRSILLPGSANMGLPLPRIVGQT